MNCHKAMLYQREYFFDGVDARFGLLALSTRFRLSKCRRRRALRQGRSVGWREFFDRIRHAFHDSGRTRAPALTRGALDVILRGGDSQRSNRERHRFYFTRLLIPRKAQSPEAEQHHRPGRGFGDDRKVYGQNAVLAIRASRGEGGIN
jgi:hypothetical protein